MGIVVDIKKSWPGFSLDVSFSSGQETLALLGESGSGKTMTLRSIAGIEKPDQGRIVLGERVLFDAEKGINLSPQERRVGYLFQNYALFPHLTVSENIAMGAHRLARKDRSRRVEEMLELMELSPLGKRYPQEISGGQAQRVALARILINDPDILLLDEPFSALDSSLGWRLEMELVDLLAQLKLPALFVSHRREEVYRICQEVCLLAKGRSGRKRPVKDFFQRPDNLAECLMSGCKNTSRALRLGDHRLYAKDWDLELSYQGLLPTKLSYVAIGAEDIGLASPTDPLEEWLEKRPEGQEGQAKDNYPSCRLCRRVEDLTHTILLCAPSQRTTKGGRLRLHISPAEKEVLAKKGRLAEGENLTLHLPAHKLMVFTD